MKRKTDRTEYFYREVLKEANGKWVTIPGNVGRWLVLTGYAEKNEDANSGKTGMGVYRASARLLRDAQ